MKVEMLRKIFSARKNSIAGDEGHGIPRGVRFWVTSGYLATALLVVIFVSWGTISHLASAVIAGGHIVVDSHSKDVQHREGGTVKTVHVRDGTRVEKGALLVTLDETAARADLEIISKSKAEFQTKIARLTAERDGAEEVVFSEDVLVHAEEPHVFAAMTNALHMFAARQSLRKSERAQLEQQLVQLEELIEGYKVQKAAVEEEYALVKEEVARLEDLFEEKLVPIARLTEAKRNASRLKGQSGAAEAEIARAKERVSEVQLAVIQFNEEKKSQILTELQDYRAQLGEAEERFTAAQEVVTRTEVRAPQSGYVNKLTVHAPGAVVQPGQTMLTIVPAEDELVVEARVATKDIDQIHPGQDVRLRFSAFNQKTTPEFSGDIVHISADAATDPKTGVMFYAVRVRFAAEKVLRNDALKLVPGMPAEVFITTGERTMLNYLLKPFRDQMARAFKEQ